MPDCFFEATLFRPFFDDLFAEAFFFEGREGADFFFPAVFFAGAFRVEVFLAEAFFTDAFLAFFLLGRFLPTDFAAFLLRVFLLAAFLLRAFFATLLVADLRAAGLRRAADFFFDAFRVEDFFLVLLTLRVFPEAFLLTPGFREDVRVLLAPARLRFLLAAFLAGMVDSCRSEKNAELYIG